MIENNGRIGYSIHENTVLTFQIGEGPLESAIHDAYGFAPIRQSLRDGQILEVDGYRVLTRGYDDRQIEDISKGIKDNRLLPEIIEKQVKIMFGEGLFVYKPEFTKDGKLVRIWQKLPEIDQWLEVWTEQLTDDPNDVAIELVRRYYYFEDFFTKWRFAFADFLLNKRVVGLELVENSKARLATQKNLGPTRNDYIYDDFTHIMVGDWRRAGDFKVYPRFSFHNVNEYTVAISHHANGDVDSMYGRNKSYEGARDWVEASNENPRFIRSFLRNALAAKVHIIIPDEWVKSKKQMIEGICTTNRKLQQKGEELYTLNGIKVGTEYSEVTLIEYTNQEIKKLTEYLSGPDNQGKAFTSFSFRSSKGDAVEWKIQQLDMKYKEYMEAMISFDRRADEVMVSAKGVDPSISNVAKEGVVSKSGSDAYYNYIIYQNQLSTAEKVICDPFNMAMRVNFPDLYREGYRFGFYRHVPAKQEEVSPNDRLNNQGHEV